jgi:hypothetical protein
VANNSLIVVGPALLFGTFAQSRNDNVNIGNQFDYPSQGVAGGGKELIQRFYLCDRPRIPVEEETALAVIVAKPVAHQIVCERVGDVISGVHECFRFGPELGVVFDIFPKNIAC